MIGLIAALFRGGGFVRDITRAIRDVQMEKLRAQTDAQRVVLERQEASLEGQLQLALANARMGGFWTNAFALGRWLIVVPYGIWWSAVLLVSTFGVGHIYVVQDLPPMIHDQARILIPAILIGDAGALVSKIWRRG